MNLNRSEFNSLLTKTFSKNGLSSYLSTDVAEKFYLLTVRMLEENEKYNLTAIKEPDKIILNHYADCVMLASRIKKSSSVIDVGCGAGFPTLPIAIVRPDLDILAVDSTAKRVSYVGDSAAMLGLSGVRTAVMRAEDGAKDPTLREQFDYATARAVAELRILSELCLPYVKPGGELLAMKGKNAGLELQAAKKAIATLGGRNPRIEDITLVDLSGEEFTHPIVTVDKTAKTPAAYPRPYAQISKKPL